MTEKHPRLGLLDRSGAQPLYLQIAQHLRGDIQRGHLPPGSSLPSEASLCKRFGVARSVVRQALAGLQAEGLVHREQGRPAIVAVRNEHRRMVQRSTGLYQQFASAGTHLRTRILRLEASVPPAEVAAFFGSEDTWLLERIRRIDTAPIAFVRTWLPRRRTPDLSAAVLEDASLHQVLATRYGIHPGRGRNRIRAVAADQHLASQLETSKGSPLLMLEGQGMDLQGQPMEWFTTWHRPEQFVFDVEVGTEGEQVQLGLPQPATQAAVANDGTVAEDPLAEMEQLLSSALDLLQRTRRHG